MTAFIYSSLSKKSQLRSKLSCNWSVSGNNVHHLVFMIQAINIPRIPLYLETFKRKTTTFETFSLAQTHAHMHAHKHIAHRLQSLNAFHTEIKMIPQVVDTTQLCRVKHFSKTIICYLVLLNLNLKMENKTKQKKVTGSFNKGKVCPAYT